MTGWGANINLTYSEEYNANVLLNQQLNIDDAFKVRIGEDWDSAFGTSNKNVFPDSSFHNEEENKNIIVLQSGTYDIIMRLGLGLEIRVSPV